MNYYVLWVLCGIGICQVFILFNSFVYCVKDMVVGMKFIELVVVYIWESVVGKENEDQVFFWVCLGTSAGKAGMPKCSIGGISGQVDLFVGI